MKKQGYLFIFIKNKNYFYLNKHKPTKGIRGNVDIDYYINKNNIDFNDYYIIKKTGNFRILDIKDIEKYSGVICFHKSMYSLDYINLWFNFLYKEIKISVPYLSMPFPPEYMLNKIKVVEWVGK
jgi:hypothetical protein